jgi:hypothetical protein
MVASTSCSLRYRDQHQPAWRPAFLGPQRACEVGVAKIPNIEGYHRLVVRII